MTCILLSIERYQFFNEENRGKLWVVVLLNTHGMSGDDTCIISGMQVRPRGEWNERPYLKKYLLEIV